MLVTTFLFSHNFSYSIKVNSQLSAIFNLSSANALKSDKSKVLSCVKGLTLLYDKILDLSKFKALADGKPVVT